MIKYFAEEKQEYLEKEKKQEQEKLAKAKTALLSYIKSQGIDLDEKFLKICSAERGYIEVPGHYCIWVEFAINESTGNVYTCEYGIRHSYGGVTGNIVKALIIAERVQQQCDKREEERKSELKEPTKSSVKWWHCLKFW